MDNRILLAIIPILLFTYFLVDNSAYGSMILQPATPATTPGNILQPNDNTANYSDLSKNTEYVSIRTSNLIGIQLSQTCLMLIKQNITNICPTYDQLQQFDTTNPNFSGKWVSTPYYHRLAPQVKNAFTFYNLPWVVMVDPDPSFTTRAKMISIQPTNFEYMNPDDIAANHTRVMYSARFVADCTQVTAAPILGLIADSITYLENGCTKTSYEWKTSYNIPENKFDYKNPYSTLLQKNYLETLLHGHYENLNNTAGGLGPGNCITHKCTTLKNPYSNW